MARKYRTHVREEKAVEFILTITDLEEYKNAWLILSNHVRVYKDTFYKVSNNEGDNIYVLCSEDSEKDVESFLSQFGELRECKEKKLAVFVDVDCDFSNFDEDYIDYEYVFGDTD